MLFFLIGFMGSGKSTVGKKLSAKLNFDFVDLDLYIEKQTNKTIETIFETEGEMAFRSQETNSLNQIIKQSKNNTLISCGGGTPCYNNNIELMKKNGTVILLEANAKSLTHRLVHSKEKRPLIKNLSENKLLSFVETKLKEREKYYTQAHIKINAQSVDINSLAEKIKMLL